MSKEDLIPFKKGQSGNPKGRPKGSLNRSTIAKKWLEVLSQEELEDGQVKWLSNEEAMTLSLIKKARNGDVNSLKKNLDALIEKSLKPFLGGNTSIEVNSRTNHI